MHHVFVYGSLLFPEIVKGLTGHLFENSTAVLSGFNRLVVKDNDYPAIVLQSGGKVQGKILFNVDKRSLEILRFFEGNEYSCISVKVKVDKKNVEAYVFVWTSEQHQLGSADWDPCIFERNALADYVRYVVPETVKEFEQSFS